MTPILVPVEGIDASNQKLTLSIETFLVLSGEPRTNNALEAWNSSFRKMLPTKHPALLNLITRFRNEQNIAEIKVEKLMSGDVIRKPKPKYSIAIEKLVQNAKTTIETIYRSIQKNLPSMYIYPQSLCIAGLF